MGDLIDRQVAIDAIGKILPVNPGLNEYTHGITIGASLAMEYIKQLPSVQSEPRWIPVSERLPEYGQRVLVTYDLVKKYPWVNILRYGKPMSEDKPCFYEAGSEWGDVPYDGIVAWMPLPEPYEEAKNAKV